MSRTWTSTDPRWQRLTPYQKAAAMALMEADRMNPEDARNALGAMINRAARTGEDLGEHVSKRIYQPTIEPAQQRRLDRIVRSGEFHNLTSWAERRLQGLEPDPVNGATHFLAPEKTMLALERQNPRKYRNWGPRGANWTGYDPKTGAYRGVIMRDQSHAFLAPEGAHSATGPSLKTDVTQSDAPDRLSAFSAAAAPLVPEASPVALASSSSSAPATFQPLGEQQQPQGGLLAGLFGGGASFQPVMSQVPAQQPNPIPTAPTIPEAPQIRRAIDLSQLAAIVARRQQQSLGVT